MSSDLRELNIYFDTNILKKIGGGLNEFEVNDTYHILKKFILGNKLDFIKVFIPQIVFDELAEQYVSEYKSTMDSLMSDLDAVIAKANKLNWSVELVKKQELDITEYKESIRYSIEQFCEKEANFISVINHCGNDKLFKIIERALRKKKPFFCGKSGKKEFSDAGFKDVIFLETILEHMESQNCDYIIISKDELLSQVNLGNELPNRNGEIISFDLGWEIASFIKKRYGIEDYSELINLGNNDYFREMIENSLKCKLVDANLDFIKQDISDISVFKMKCKISINDEDKDVWVMLSDAYDFIEVADELTQEVIFEWES